MALVGIAGTHGLRMATPNSSGLDNGFLMTQKLEKRGYLAMATTRDTSLAVRAMPSQVFKILRRTCCPRCGLAMIRMNGRPFDIGNVPIVFVAFCLGGLVMKMAHSLGLVDRQYYDMSRRIAAVIFLATPHRGTDMAQAFDRFSRWSKIIPRRTFVVEMMPSSPVLKEINDKFRHDPSNLLIWSFYETQETNIGMSRLLVVAKDSAVLGYQGEIVISLDTDHVKATKFASPTDTNYLKVLNGLKGVARQLPGERHGLYAPLSFEKIEVRKHPSSHGSKN
jgi:hypothetical protein